MIRNDVDAEWLYNKIKYYKELNEDEMAERYFKLYINRIPGVDKTKARKLLEKKTKKSKKTTKGDE